jgi:hypothetical protein
MPAVKVVAVRPPGNETRDQDEVRPSLGQLLLGPDEHPSRPSTAEESLPRRRADLAPEQYAEESPTKAPPRRR